VTAPVPFPVGGASVPGAVPEPSQWLAMSIATAFVGGLILRARQKRNRTAADSNGQNR
jgi:hypothetical protein